jgi:hypothetical protein
MLLQHEPNRSLRMVRSESGLKNWDSWDTVDEIGTGFTANDAAIISRSWNWPLMWLFLAYLEYNGVLEVA